MWVVKPAIVFAASVAAAVSLCSVGAGPGYLAPFMATAAVLANTDANIRSAAVTIVAAYLICILLGAVTSLIGPVTVTVAALVCLVGFLLCMLLKRQHPPALAMLAVVFLHSPGSGGVMWLVGTAVAVPLLAVAVHLASTSVLSKRWFARLIIGAAK